MISEMDFAFPSKREQEMMIAFLDNLTTLIVAQQEELEKLQNIKSACLSKMFV
jgi:restriction endonuclease S subunit